MDRYSQAWSWKITGSKAISMVSKMIAQSWYGDGVGEVIVPDNVQNIQQLQWIADRHPLEILSKSVWKRKSVKPRQKMAPMIQKYTLKRAKPKAQFKGKLLDFQKEGLDFLLKSSGNALLADEMGLGKTVQTLAYLSTEEQPFPAIVVAPLVTLKNWEREIGKFMFKKSRNGRILKKSTPTTTMIRRGKSADLGEFDFYIINYELLERRLLDLSKIGARSLICDEVQHLRSKSTRKYSAVLKLSKMETIKHRIGLSGTPIYNRGSEIWPIIDILKPGMLGNYREFCEYFCYLNEKGKAIVLENKRESLRKQLQEHVMLRRKKADVLRELKGKVRHREVIDSDSQYYVGELEKIWKKMLDDKKHARTSFDKSASYQRAIQSERQAAGIAKLPHVINFVKGIMEIEESVVVFCHHKAIHKLLHEQLTEFSPVSIIGGQSDKDRQNSIDDFQDGKSNLMIAGLRAGNVGINLSRARYVVFAELDWSPAIHRQAEDRLHRLGQKNTVFAYYLVGDGTLDNHVADILVDKGFEIDSIMDGNVDRNDDGEKARRIMEQIQERLQASGTNVEE